MQGLVRMASGATTLEVLVSAQDDAEVRRVTISNSSDSTREVEVTSYAELVLAPQAADVAHPAFSKLFIETEHLAANPDLHDKFWNATKLAGAAKKSEDPAQGQELLNAVDEMVDSLARSLRRKHR